MAEDRAKCRSGKPSPLESTEGPLRFTTQLLLLQTPRGGERPERAGALDRSGLKEATPAGSGSERSYCKKSPWGWLEKTQHRPGGYFILSTHLSEFSLKYLWYALGLSFERFPPPPPHPAGPRAREKAPASQGFWDAGVRLGDPKRPRRD